MRRGDAGTRWFVIAVAAIALVALGAAGAWFVMGRSMGGVQEMPAKAGGVSGGEAGGAAGPAAASQAPLPDVTITLSAEAVERAGIRVTPVRLDAKAGALRLPGVVEPNDYRQVVVTPIAAGRITRVAVALGDRVTRGQSLAEVYSPELADAQTRYLTMRAELEAAHQELRRTERLVEIGAASTQELERVRAQHTAHATGVEGARSRLTLLGLGSSRIARLRTAADITSTVGVPAPLAGVVTKRSANVGLNVDPATELFTLVDLSTVWVIADVYERDFSRVAVGSAATVTTAAYAGLALPGRVSYIDPQVTPETRTAKLRVEVANRGQQLRLGMYADVSVMDAAPAGVPVIPRTAVQSIGDRQVVYLVDSKQPGTFVEREVRLGEAAGRDVEVAAGVAAGDTIVSDGTFYLRAERERLGLRAAAPLVQELRVLVTDDGYSPDTMSLGAGVPVRLVFTRTSDKTCGTEVVFPEEGLRRPLPLKQPVAIELAASTAREIAFTCGMGMLKGKVVIRPAPAPGARTSPQTP